MDKDFSFKKTSDHEDLSNPDLDLLSSLDLKEDIKKEPETLQVGELAQDLTEKKSSIDFEVPDLDQVHEIINQPYSSENLLEPTDWDQLYVEEPGEYTGYIKSVDLSKLTSSRKAAAVSFVINGLLILVMIFMMFSIQAKTAEIAGLEKSNGTLSENNSILTDKVSTLTDENFSLRKEIYELKNGPRVLLSQIRDACEQKDWKTAAALYEELKQNYPDSSEADEAKSLNDKALKELSKANKKKNS